MTTKEVVLEVKNVSKSFKMRDTRADSIKETITRFFVPGKNVSREFSALKDVSFELRKGEALGIIGKNGAGKSTLLRILSGISKPDQGEINFYGRPVSILDVGAGFHPELTGRENIYLSASLYKFTKAKVEERYKQIVDFSGIEEFIDEPVKNYSAGMYLRLAFSIITCLDADIYLIDEVINVGDANFHTKCKSRMEELIAGGKTLLIASHDLNEIAVLCSRIILLDGGIIVDSGDTDIIQKYMTRTLPQYFKFEENNFYHQRDLKERLALGGEVKILSGGLKDYKVAGQGISAQNPFTIFFELELSRPAPILIRLKIYDSTGVLVFVCSSQRHVEELNAAGKYMLEFEIPPDILNERMYSVDMVMFNFETKDSLLRADKFLTLKMGIEAVTGAQVPEPFTGVVRAAGNYAGFEN